MTLGEIDAQIAALQAKSDRAARSKYWHIFDDLEKQITKLKTQRIRCEFGVADEYDTAQERGEVARRADGPAIRDHVPAENKIATAADIGLTRKDIFDARLIRGAEVADPDRLAELERRLTLLEQRPELKYLGVWKDGQAYPAGTLCTDRGALWYCNETSSSRPGSGAQCGWTMAAKSGANGKAGR